MRSIAFVLVMLFATYVSAQVTTPEQSAQKTIQHLKTAYGKAIDATIQDLDKAGYKAVAGKIELAVDSRHLFTDAVEPYLITNIQIVRPYETSGDIPEQVKKVVRENMMKIVRTLNASLEGLATSDDIAGVCINLTWGPNDSSTNTATILVNKYTIEPFLEGKLSLREFVTEKSKVMLGDQNVKLQF